MLVMTIVIIIDIVTVIVIIIIIIVVVTCSNKFKKARVVRLPNHVGWPALKSSQGGSWTPGLAQKSLVQAHCPENKDVIYDDRCIF